MDIESTKTKTLVFGILSLALSSTVIVSLIMAILGLKNAKAVIAAEGMISGKAKVGKILSTIGLVCSIVVLAIYVIMIIATAVTAGVAALN